MSVLFKTLVLGILGGLCGGILSLTPWITHLEEDIGLTRLFHQRGPRAAPRDVVIIAIDKDSADRFGIKGGPNEWPRDLHTRLLKKLSQAGASAISFDILFKKHRSEVDDQALGQAMSDAGNVILIEGLARESIDTQGSAGTPAEMLIEKLVLPIPVLTEAAVAMAPFPLPKVPVRVSQFWKFSPDAADAPTLPVVSFQLYALEVYPQFLSILQKVNPGDASQLPQTRDEIINGTGLIKFMRQLRILFMKDNDLTDAMLTRLKSDDMKLNPQRKQLLLSFVRLYRGGQSQYLNFYGPARSINTIPYYKVLSKESDSNTTSDMTDFHNKLVFIGSSEIKQWEQHDGFYSVYSNPETGLDVSGVEIAATATANLLDGIPVKPLTPFDRVLLVFCWGLCLAIFCRLFTVIWATISVIGVSIIYYWSAVTLFSSTGIWLPLVTPLLIQSPLILFAGVMWTYLDTNRERRNIRKAFGFYLPSKIVDRLIKEGPDFGASGHLVYGICLFTDAEQYTRLAEQLDPKVLGALMNDYYKILFEPVRRRDGIVSDVVGDSMLAIWTGPHPDKDLRTQACHAGLELVQAQHRFNELHGDRPLPTRIGLHCGNMLLGNVGAIDHYEYRAVGDIVNTATRIQGVNKYLGTHLLVSEETLTGVEGVLTRELGEFILAGKTRQIRLFEILCRQDDANESLYALCDDFMQALTTFRKQQWDQAGDHFKKIMSRQGEDPPSRYYLALCAHYSKNPPPEDWEGVINLKTK